MKTKKSNEKRISIWKKMFVVVVALAMVMMMNNTAFAAYNYTYGTILGHVCYASVGIAQSSGSGETTCDTNSAACSVVITVHFYMTNSSGQVVPENTTRSRAGGGSAYATAILPTGAHGDYTTSVHVVTYSTGTPWTPSLYVHI